MKNVLIEKCNDENIQQRERERERRGKGRNFQLIESVDVYHEISQEMYIESGDIS